MFLACTPTVFVVENRYEILIHAHDNGIFAIEIGNSIFYENNNGCLSSQKKFAKISVPQKLLDEYKYYTVIFRKTIERKAYFSQLESHKYQKFEFKPLTKASDINIYLLADVHYHLDLATKPRGYFKNDLDLLVLSGDIGEVESYQNYFEVSKFLGDISGGKIPVIFARGNHDVRGAMAENFTDFFPSVNKNTYFYFELPTLCGIVSDCGEDKADTHEEYGGVNAFHTFRINQTKYLATLKKASKPCFVVSHICPNQTTENIGNAFDIERSIYTKWTDHYQRIGVKFMLCGHIHKTYILQSNDQRAIIKNPYPVIVGSALPKNDFIGSALTLIDNKLLVKFTNCNHEVLQSYTLDLDSGTLID